MSLPDEPARLPPAIEMAVESLLTRVTVEQLHVKETDVLVFRCPPMSDAAGEAIVQVASELHDRTRCLVIILDKHTDLMALSEADMRVAGWDRAPGDAAPDASAPIPSPT